MIDAIENWLKENKFDTVRIGNHIRVRHSFHNIWVYFHFEKTDDIVIDFGMGSHKHVRLSIGDPKFFGKFDAVLRSRPGLLPDFCGT